jgi:hypothetical protein
MTKVLVKFRTGYSRYNQGETAAFEAAKAEQLCAGKNPVAQVVGPVKGASAQSSDSIDLLGLERQELALAGENLGEQLAEIERREENLVNALAFHNECERDLEARELAISEREKAIETAAKSGAEKEPAVKVESQPAAPVEDVAEAKDKAPGAPPKQGAKS